MLSCARNQANSLESRQKLANTLVRELEKIALHKESLFFMLLQVYKIYYAFLGNTSPASPLEDLLHWCNKLESQGFPGWKNRLQPVMDKVAQGEKDAAELLCSVIPYH